MFCLCVYVYVWRISQWSDSRMVGEGKRERGWKLMWITEGWPFSHFLHFIVLCCCYKSTFLLLYHPSSPSHLTFLHPFHSIVYNTRNQVTCSCCYNIYIFYISFEKNLWDFLQDGKIKRKEKSFPFWGWGLVTK